MFCSKCGAQVGPDARVCPQCGNLQGSAPEAPPVYAAPVWRAPVGVKAQTGRWISAGWNMVTADMGNFALLSLVFVLVNSVASVVTQGPLQTGFHLYIVKKMYRKGGDIGDLFKGFDYFVASFVAALLIAIFVFA